MRLYGFEIVEHLALEQAERYNDLLDTFRKFLEEQTGWPDEAIDKAVAEEREFLMNDLRRYIGEVVAFVMGGGRLPSEPLH